MAGSISIGVSADMPPDPSPHMIRLCMPVDGECLPADHLRLVAGQKHTQIGDLFRFRKPLDRLPADIFLPHLVRRALAAFRFRRDHPLDPVPRDAPGQIAFTRTLNGPSSIASDFVSPITPHFAAL